MSLKRAQYAHTHIHIYLVYFLFTLVHGDLLLSNIQCDFSPIITFHVCTRIIRSTDNAKRAHRTSELDTMNVNERAKQRPKGDRTAKARKRESGNMNGYIAIASDKPNQIELNFDLMYMYTRCLYHSVGLMRMGKSVPKLYSTSKTFAVFRSSVHTLQWYLLRYADLIVRIEKYLVRFGCCCYSGGEWCIQSLWMSCTWYAR